jgi:antirestriction protein ArdC
VIEALETGTVPWQKPWISAGILPTSVSTGRAYRGINVWLLSMTAQARGYSSPFWMTFKQAQERGGSICKGEKGTLVVFWKIREIEDEVDGETVTKKIPMVRHYVVFNLEQTEGVTLPPRFILEDTDREPVEVGQAMTEVLESYVDGPHVRHVRGDSANYLPLTDVVTLPDLDQFASTEAFASTALHELVHSTGHESRLDRFERDGGPQPFGSERYAREELVAEMGAAMLAAIAGIETSFDNSAAYVANWLGALRDDKSLVIRAAQAAQKAVDRVLGSEPVQASRSAAA